MKNKVFSFMLSIFLSLLSLPLFSQNLRELKGTLVPHDVYVGDRCSVFYSFALSENLFMNLPQDSIHDGKVSVSPDCIHFVPEEEAGTILSAYISKKDFEYELSISFIPWKTGELLFAPMNIEELLFSLQDPNLSKTYSSTHTLTPLPFKVLSITQKMNASTLRPSNGPLLLPGTRYVLILIVTVCLLFLTGIVFCIIHFSKIVAFIKKLKVQYSFSKNERLAKKHLTEILKADLSDRDFAEKWQFILRTYLSKRFGINFSSVPSRRIYSLADSAASGFLSESKGDALEEIMQSFIRTDYIRFAFGSLDSQTFPREEHEAVFLAGEKENLVKRTVKDIETFEKEEEE